MNNMITKKYSKIATVRWFSFHSPRLVINPRESGQTQGYLRPSVALTNTERAFSIVEFLPSFCTEFTYTALEAKFSKLTSSDVRLLKIQVIGICLRFSRKFTAAIDILIPSFQVIGCLQEISCLSCL